jgi:hypothetical protein
MIVEEARSSTTNKLSLKQTALKSAQNLKQLLHHCATSFTDVHCSYSTTSLLRHRHRPLESEFRPAACCHLYDTHLRLPSYRSDIRLIEASALQHHLQMADSGAGTQPKPSSSVKLVLLGEAAVGKVRVIHFNDGASTQSSCTNLVIPRPPVREQ